MKSIIVILIVFCSWNVLSAQPAKLKKQCNAEELDQIRSILEKMSTSDQEFRNLIANNTLDKMVITKIDSVFENHGIPAGFAYKKQLNQQKLPKSTLDSLWKLQHQNDLNNHLTLKGIFDTYGFIPEDLIGDVYSTQLVILLHPPADWNIEQYHSLYAEMLLPEVKVHVDFINLYGYTTTASVRVYI